MGWERCSTRGLKDAMQVVYVSCLLTLLSRVPRSVVNPHTWEGMGDGDIVRAAEVRDIYRWTASLFCGGVDHPHLTLSSPPLHKGDQRAPSPRFACVQSSVIKNNIMYMYGNHLAPGL